MEYEKYVRVLKAMGDKNRLKIIDLLSCGTMCACDILKHFDFTQPTLSHHMKVLQDADVVIARKEERWQYYTLNPEFVSRFQIDTAELLDDQKSCVCHREDGKTGDC